ncbi:MAG: hypothetical protein NTW96_24630 [Planctomycetia bacterium]|nr:hypothetical protein [Planctomycetia bacterium]
MYEQLSDAELRQIVSDRRTRVRQLMADLLPERERCLATLRRGKKRFQTDTPAHRRILELNRIENETWEQLGMDELLDEETKRARREKASCPIS